MDKAHGRIEQRRVWVLSATAEETGMPHARSIVRAQTEHQSAEGTTTLSERYYTCSLSPEEVGAERMAGLVRGHWNIEVGSHWQRDVLWREDAHQMRHHTRAHVLSTLRQTALHLHTMAGLNAAAPAAMSHRARRAVLRLGQTIGQITRPL